MSVEYRGFKLNAEPVAGGGVSYSAFRHADRWELTSGPSGEGETEASMLAVLKERVDGYYEDRSCWVDGCVFCGAHARHQVAEEEISRDEHGDALCPECGGSRDVYGTDVCCAPAVRP